jgi:response regulator RpfG family c-di-GMP phosphodiesterase
MESEYQHRLLVVDRSGDIGKAIDTLPEMEKIERVFIADGEGALEKLRTTQKPFSLILADQQINGMTGIEFFEQAKGLAPFTPRFLTAADSDMNTIIQAVNKGAVQHYITKPWDTNDLVLSVQRGISQFKRFLENENLLTLAKQQNTKLYDLNCELMEATKTHNTVIRELDRDIEAIQSRTKELSRQTPLTLGDLFEEIVRQVRKGPDISREKRDAFFSGTVQKIYAQFNELAQRSGFEMPGTDGDLT